MWYIGNQIINQAKLRRVINNSVYNQIINQEIFWRVIRQQFLFVSCFTFRTSTNVNGFLLFCFQRDLSPWKWVTVIFSSCKVSELSLKQPPRKKWSPSRRTCHKRFVIMPFINISFSIRMAGGSVCVVPCHGCERCSTWLTLFCRSGLMPPYSKTRELSLWPFCAPRWSAVKPDWNTHWNS